MHASSSVGMRIEHTPLSRTANAPPSWGRLALLWLAGIDLRVTILAIPPVLPLIHHDLSLDEKAVATLTGLPVLLLGLGAIPGSLLISRIGPRRALISGLALIAVASAARGVGPSNAMLFAMTLVMGIGVAVIQPAFPALVGEWFETGVGLATAVYANGLIFGELLGAGLALSVVVPMVHGSWGSSLAVWGALVLITTFAVVFTTPHVPREAHTPRALWWPDWHDPQTWRLGIMQGGLSAMYFGVNAFIPDYLHAMGRPELVGPALTAINGGQIPASLLLLVVAKHAIGRRSPLVMAALLALVGLAGVLSPLPWLIITGAGVIGFAGAIALILMLALPPLLTETGDAHRLSAGMFTVGYSSAFFIPLVGGAIWDATHMVIMAFLPVILGALTMIAMASSLNLAAARNR